MWGRLMRCHAQCVVMTISWHATLWFQKRICVCNIQANKFAIINIGDWMAIPFQCQIKIGFYMVIWTEPPNFHHTCWHPPVFTVIQLYTCLSSSSSSISSLSLSHTHTHTHSLSLRNLHKVRRLCTSQGNSNLSLSYSPTRSPPLSPLSVHKNESWHTR